MMRIIFCLLFCLVHVFVNAQENNTPQYTFKNKLGVGRSGFNDTVAYLQVGPNTGGTKGAILPRIADTTVLVGTKKKGLIIYDDSKDSLAYWNGVRFQYLPSTGGTVTNADNGLTMVGSNIGLDGILIRNTNINTGAFNMAFDNSSDPSNSTIFTVLQQGTNNRSGYLEVGPDRISMEFNSLLSSVNTVFIDSAVITWEVGDTSGITNRVIINKDSTTFIERAGYNSNINGSLTPFNFVTKRYVDSISAISFPSGYGTADSAFYTSDLHLKKVIDSLHTQYGSHVAEFSSTADATVANTATETTLIASGSGSSTVEATHITAGGTITIYASGTLNTDGVTAGQITFRWDLGSIGIDAAAITTLATGLSDDEWEAVLEIKPNSIGASNAFRYSMRITIKNGGSPITQWQNGNGTGQTNANAAVAFTADWDTADTDNSITCQNFRIITERIR